MTLYKKLIRPLLFRLDPESAHHVALEMGKLVRFPPIRSLTRLAFSSHKFDVPVTAFGLTFPNPIWLASGIDKDAVAVDLFSSLGFGSIELGGVVPRPQPGNDRPRLHRFPSDQALINRMGFPSAGCVEVARNLETARSRLKSSVILGINLAKGASTPVENAAEDYVESFRTTYDYVDFFTVNVSCPNVAQYQVLQERKHLSLILDGLQKANRLGKPLVLKLSPDLTEDATVIALETAVEYGVKGVIATNTSTRRDYFPQGQALAGGLSGVPLFPYALERIKFISERFASKLDVIGAGGIATADHVRQMLAAGTKAIQLYTALVYQGPGLVSRLKEELAVVKT